MIRLAIQKNPDIRLDDLPEQLGMGLSTIKKQLKKDHKTTFLTIKNEISSEKEPEELIPNLPPSIPQTPQILPNTSNIPEDFKELVRLANYANSMGLDTRLTDVVQYKKTRRQIELESQSQSIDKKFVFMRPKVFHPKQHEIVDAWTNPLIKLLFCEGAQRSGKSTGNFEGIHELVLQSTRALKIILLAGKGGNKGQGGSKQILHDMITDPILKENNDKMIVKVQNGACWWENGTTLEARDLTVAAIKGSDADIVIIDELDVAIAGGEVKRKAVVSAINTMLATPNFKLVLTANLDRGIYQLLRDELMDLEEDFVKVIQITKEDCPHLLNSNVSANSNVARVMSDVLMGKGFGDMRIDGIMSSLGDTFDMQAIKDAYDCYDTYLAQSDLPLLRAMALDPSGTGHPFGWVILGYDERTDTIVEIDSGMMQLGTGKDGITWSPEKIDTFLLSKAKEHGVKYFSSESNSGGHQYIIKMKAAGIRSIICQWQGKDTSISHESFIKLTNHFLTERQILLKNPDLKKQLVIYDPAKDKEQHKGDIADALLCCLWNLVGGIQYIKKMNRQILKQVVSN